MAKDWDQYWNAKIAAQADREYDPPEESWLLEVLAGLDEQPPGSPSVSPRRSVLVIGCGISVEPAALAHAGNEVIAIDLSRVAVDHVTRHPATPVQVARWFGLGELDLEDFGRSGGQQRHEQNLRHPDPDEVRRVLDEHHGEGGSLVTLCMDFRTFATDRRFDVVYIPFTWHCLEADAQEELARRAFAWLAPGGLCMLTTLGVQGEPLSRLHRVIAEAGFFNGGWPRPSLQIDAPSQTVQRANRDRRRDRQRLRARLATGEKMYVLINGR